jgi:hypothetical protein
LAVFIDTIVFVTQYCCGEMWALCCEAGVFVVGVAASVEPNVIRCPIVSAVLVRMLVATCQSLFEVELIFTVQKSEQGTPLSARVVAQFWVIGYVCPV